MTINDNSSLNPAYEAALAYQKTAALTAAVKLDIFTLIGGATATSDFLSEKAGCSRRGMRVLCDFLTIINLLKKDDRGYSATAASRGYFDRSSSTYIGNLLDFLASPEIVRLVLDDPVSYVKQGGSTGLANTAPDNPIWVCFARAMEPIASVTAKRVAAHLSSLPTPPRTLLDVAAGHGLFGVELAKALPELLVTAVDWDEVLKVAQANAETAGVGERFRMTPGNALEVEWGSHFDLVLLTNFLHHFSTEECVSILKKARSSLSEGGRVCAVEFVPDENRVSPPLPAMFAFLMLATTPNGDAYTLSDLDKMSKAAGFKGAVSRPLRPTSQTLVTFEI